MSDGIRTILILLTFMVLNAMIIIKTGYTSLQNDWINQRCKPSVIPFAGLINAPEGTSYTDFTKENHLFIKFL